jgi:hypothetical protein
MTFTNANLCDKVGADVHQIAKVMGLDGRISPKFFIPVLAMAAPVSLKTLRHFIILPLSADMIFNF